MIFRYEKTDFSASVKFANGTSIDIRSDLSRLTDYQKIKLKDFVESVFRRPLGLEEVITD